ncbi:MAG: hypothetical protein K6G08_02200 [Prevotella sp.]|nr:hypothetical protein [Prevotella sp.]
MRKRLWLFLAGMMLMSLQQVSAQMKPAKRYAPAYEQECYEDMPMVKAGKGWATRSIKVRGGGKAPDIVQLTKAFNSVWKVEVVGNVLQLAKDPNFTKLENPEYDSETIVDRRNGYICVSSGGTDSDYMEACVWKRDNGHRLFAICMGSPTDPEIELVCFYDYDPVTQTMTPETSPADTFKLTEEFYSYNLPRIGKDFSIVEYILNDDEFDIEHVFTFDGMKHVYSHDRKIKKL